MSPWLSTSVTWLTFKQVVEQCCFDTKSAPTDPGPLLRSGLNKKMRYTEVEAVGSLQIVAVDQIISTTSCERYP